MVMKKVLGLSLIMTILSGLFVGVPVMASGDEVVSTVKLAGTSFNQNDPVNIILTDKSADRNIKYINQINPEDDGSWKLNFKIEGTLSDYNVLFRQNNTVSSEIGEEFIASITEGISAELAASIAARTVTASYNIKNPDKENFTCNVYIVSYDNNHNLVEAFPAPEAELTDSIEEIEDEIIHQIPDTAAYTKIFCWYGMVPLAKPEVVQPAGDYVVNRGSLGNVFTKLNNGEDVTIVYLGGSITHGSNASWQDDYATSWRGRTTSWFREQYPDSNITSVNAGIGGTGSFWGSIRTYRDVLSHNPDLVFVMSPINDVYEGMSEANTKRQMEDIIRQIRDYNPETDIVMGYDTDKKRSEIETATGKTDLYDMVEWQEEVARAYDISSMDMGRYLADQVVSGNVVWDEVVNPGDNVHPLDAGHALYAEKAIELLEDGKSKAPLAVVEYTMSSDRKFGTSLNGRVYKGADKFATGDAALVNGSGNYAKNYELAQGKSMTFEVTGNKIGIYSSTGASYTISVDGKSASSVPSLSGGVYRSNTDFGSGTHSVTLTNTGSSTATVKAVFTWND